MDQTSTNINPNATKKFNNAQYPLIEIERTFRAPVEFLWSAWASEDIIKQWWGPEKYTCPEAHINFKVGGKCQLAMKGPEGKVIWSGGVYKEIIPNQIMVCTDHFMDDKGQLISAESIGMPGNWPAECLITIEFKQSENGTTMSIQHEGLPKEMQDDCLQGWNSSIDKLQKLIDKKFSLAQ